MIFLDAHVHIYPDYDLDRLFDCFCARAKKLAPADAQLAMVVMLREFQPTLSSLFEGRPQGKWRVKGPAGPSALVVTDGGRDVTLVAARQVAAAERVEALGFFGETPVPDGLPYAETLARLRGAGYLPVLAWGLGKWLGKRAKIVDAALASADAVSAPLLIGDCALRPTFWPTPAPYRAARAKGLQIVFGSDPLPRPGDERAAGRYATLVDASFDPAGPAASLLETLRSPAIPLRAVGRRYGLLATLKHLK